MSDDLSGDMLAPSWPNLVIKGCTFKWTQAVWRKIQELGLAPTYYNEEGTQTYLGETTGLPKEFISTVFLNAHGHLQHGPVLCRQSGKTMILKVGVVALTGMLVEGNYNFTC